MKKKMLKFDEDGYTDTPKDVEKSMRASARDHSCDNLFPPNTKFVKKQPKVSISVDSQIVHHFKKYAKEHNTQYQTAINDILLSHIRQQ